MDKVCQGCGGSGYNGGEFCGCNAQFAPFAYGDEVEVKQSPGRIERTRFVVSFATKCGDEYRYTGWFVGSPPWYGNVYSDDIAGFIATWPESAVIELQGRTG